MTKLRHRVRHSVSILLWSIVPVIALVIVAVYGGLALTRHVYPPVVPVEGTSMNPLLRFGDLVLLKRADIGQLRKGDIIAFRTTSDVQQKWDVPGSYVHRIVTVERGAYGKQFQTKGDNVAGKDPFWTVEQNVIGIYAGKIKGGGYPILFARSKEGKILLAGLVLIMFIYWILGVFERRQAVELVNIHNLSTIVDEARRITAKMEEGVPAPPVKMEEGVLEPPIQSVAPETTTEPDLVRPRNWLISGDFLTGAMADDSPSEVVEAQRIARILDTALEASPWPRYDVAARADISLPAMQAMLEGDILPDFATVIRLGKLLGVSIWPAG